MLTAYQDLYTVAEYEVRVSEIGDEYRSISNSNFLQQAKDMLLVQIKKAKENEKKIFARLNVANIDELNQRMASFRKTVLNLSGPALYNQIILVLEQENAKEINAFENAVNEIIDKDIIPGLDKNFSIEELREKIFELLNTNLRRFSSSSGMQRIGEIHPSYFTKEQQNRWKEILNDYEDLPNVRKYLNIMVNNQENEEEATFDWNLTIQNLTANEAKETLKYDQVKKINEAIKQKIVAMVDGDEADKILVSKIIDHILSHNFYEFFVGKNTNSIVGTCGEIAGLFYLAKFLGGLEHALTWSGGNIAENGKKPHRDIVLEEQFGIQVKNTTKEEISNISFTDVKLNTILERLKQSKLDTTQLESLISNYYGTLNFNVKYIIEDGIYKEVNEFDPPLTPKQRTFSSNYERLQKMQINMDTLLSYFAATFMFLDVYDKSSYIDGNSLFLLGIDTFTTASNILTSIIEDLEAKQHKFSISSSLIQGRNIVDALNAGAEVKNYTEFYKENLKLKTSYNFSL